MNIDCSVDWLQLSDEIWFSVFFNFTSKELMPVTAVCSDLRRISCDDTLWKNFYRQLWPWDTVTLSSTTVFSDLRVGISYYVFYSQVESRSWPHYEQLPKRCSSVSWRYIYCAKLRFERELYDKLPRQEKSANITHVLPFSLKDLYCGKKKKLRVSRSDICRDCSGAGSSYIGPSEYCTPCQGRGTVQSQRQLAPGMIQPYQTTCTLCYGNGFRRSRLAECSTCRGSGLGTRSVIIEVNVEPGAFHGVKYIFPNRGGAKIGYQSADIVLTIDEDRLSESKNPQGQDCKAQVIDGQIQRMAKCSPHLTLSKEISLSDALFGVEFDFEHLDGRVLHVTMPNPLLEKERKADNSEVTEPSHEIPVIKQGDFLRIRNEGMPLRPGDKRMVAQQMAANRQAHIEEGWECTSCTFKNTKGSTCEMCGGVRKEWNISRDEKQQSNREGETEAVRVPERGDLFVRFAVRMPDLGTLVQDPAKLQILRQIELLFRELEGKKGGSEPKQQSSTPHQLEYVSQATLEEISKVRLKEEDYYRTKDDEKEEGVKCNQQ